MSWRARTACAAGAAALLLALSGCAGGGVDVPGETDIDVNTPQLQAMKADAAIEDCEPGGGSGGGLPDLTLPCLGGGSDVNLSELTGPLVINFWSSNCPPCRDEMPVLQEFHETYGDQVDVLGVDYLDTYPEAALDLVDRSGVTYPSLADPAGDLGETSLVIQALPQFVYVAPDGTMASRGAGGVDSLSELVEKVEAGLGIDLHRSGG